MTINGITVDTSKGFDVFSKTKLLRHFETYKEARAYADAARSRYIRYWAVKGK